MNIALLRAARTRTGGVRPPLPSARTRRPAAAIVALCALCLALFPQPAAAYLKFGVTVNGTTKPIRWQSAPITYYVNDASVPNVTAAAFQAAVARAFKTWEDVPTATISYRFAGFTSARPGDDDGMSTLGFRNEPTLERVLATTSYLIDDVTGELLESDIFFNSAFAWSASQDATPNMWDLQSIATHEIGHFNGLGHSAIGETEMGPNGRRVVSIGAVMFPIALGVGDITGRVLDADDIAGVSDLYANNQFTATTGSVSGRVLKNGNGVFGAHVVAFDLKTGDQVANFTLTPTGAFSIAGLRAGPHLLRVEPLDDADLESFFGSSDAVDIRFQTRYFDRVVVVPRGGDSGTVVIAVTPK